MGCETAGGSVDKRIFRRTAMNASHQPSWVLDFDKVLGGAALAVNF